MCIMIRNHSPKLKEVNKSKFLVVKNSNTSETPPKKKIQLAEHYPKQCTTKNCRAHSSLSFIRRWQAFYNAAADTNATCDLQRYPRTRALIG